MDSSSRKKRNRSSPNQASSLDNAQSVNGSGAGSQINQWSKQTRVLVSVALLAYLFLLILGPLSNPIGSENLTRPIASAVAPAHRALFLGHGYRFFGPDPGASHLVEYTIKQNDGSKIEGHFPDRETIWPRLLYHRWFMLSETVYAEHSLTPVVAEFEQTQAAMLDESRRMKVAGELRLSATIMEQRSQLREEYQATRRRIDSLVRGIAKGLMDLHGDENSQSISLFVREREIPFPREVASGMKLNDPRYLVPKSPPKIGDFTRVELLAHLLNENGTVPESNSAAGGAK